MKRPPVTPARIDIDAEGLPLAPDFGDVYHARAGALEQARHVFLAGNDLPARWQGRERFTVLETGFGLGNNFIATWAAWRADPARCARLHYVAIDRHPPRRDDLLRVHAGSPEPGLARALVEAWPPLCAGLHPVALDGGAVRLTLAWGDAAWMLPQLLLQADALYLDGFAPARNAELWSERVFKPLARLAAPGATAATWSVARPVREGLQRAGFEVERAAGFAAKREMTRARFAPVFVARRTPGHPLQAQPAADAPRTALVVGAGLAGAAGAQALAAAGWRVTVLERHAEPAAETSGNRGGLFHGVVNGQDGPHARFNRAAALLAAATYAPLIARGAVPGRLDGLLRLAGADADVAAMRALLAAQGLPPEVVQVLDAAQAAEAAGLPLREPAWLYPGGGWLQPGALVRHWLQRPGIELRTGADAQALRELPGGGWAVLDGAGRELARATVLVLANAAGAPALLDTLEAGATGWPLGRQRGQVTLVDAGTPGLALPRLPVAGGGYALALPGGGLLCGATAQLRDEDASLREADQRFNLQRLRRFGLALPEALPLAGRVGWRLLADDRLPVVGAVPVAGAPASRVRDLPRRTGLIVCTALASRGIAWAPLLGELVAAWAGGGPFPLEAELVEAVDPGRFSVRRVRREAAAAAAN